MKKLSELGGETLLCVDSELADEEEVMTKDELVSRIRSGNIGDGEIYVYLAEGNPASLTMDDLRFWMEQLEDQCAQYADWHEDMMLDLERSEEAKAFIETVNRLAREHMSYDEGERVDIWR